MPDSIAKDNMAMPKNLLSEIHKDLPREGLGREQYTKKAFRMLPTLDVPRILDVGCGTGGPTLQLALLSRGQVIGLDIHEPSLKILATKIEEAGLSDRVQVVKCSMFQMGFRDQSFDIIWAEGAIFVIGFERGLDEWHRLIEPGGFLVVHEMVWLRPDPPPEIWSYWKRRYPGIRSVSGNLEQIPAGGYDLLGYFALPEDAWWTEYYRPLEKRIRRLREKYAHDSEALSVLDNEQREIDMYKKYQPWYGSAFFVMQKQDRDGQSD